MYFSPANEINNYQHKGGSDGLSHPESIKSPYTLGWSPISEPSDLTEELIVSFTVNENDFNFNIGMEPKKKKKYQLYF